MSTLMEHIERSLHAARDEHWRQVERALDHLERHFGISRDRVNERLELEVSPEEYAQILSTSIQLANFEIHAPLQVNDFQIKIIVVKPEPMCDRTLACEATKEHFLSCHAAPWKVAR